MGRDARRENDVAGSAKGRGCLVYWCWERRGGLDTWYAEAGTIRSGEPGPTCPGNPSIRPFFTEECTIRRRSSDRLFEESKHLSRVVVFSSGAAPFETGD